MRKNQEISIQKIAPYIRYVNNIALESGFILDERVIYDHEFIFVLGGEAKMLYGQEEYHLGRSDLFYMKPNIKNTMFIEEGKSFRTHCVHFDWVQVDEQFNFTAEQYYTCKNFTPEEQEYVKKLQRRPAYEVSDFCVPTHITALNYDVMAPMFKELYYCFCQSDISSRLKARGVFLKIIAELLLQKLTEHGVQKGHFHQKTISQAIHYMNEHYAEDINTPQLAKQFGLSSKYFGVLFKSMTGMAVHKYLLDIRMQHAKRLLLHSQMHLDQIAIEIGIGDVFYFTKLFKCHERITPGKYRMMLSNLSE